MMQSLIAKLRQNTNQLRISIDNNELDAAIHLVDARLVLLEQLSLRSLESEENKELARAVAIELMQLEKDIILTLEDRKSEVGKLLIKLGIGNKASSAYNDCREK